MIRRGEIWIANFNPTRGNQIGRIRPALVIQDDALLNSLSPTIVVLPLSSLVDFSAAEELSLFVRLEARDRLLKPSVILVQQPRTVDRTRIGQGPLTRLSDAEMARVDRVLGLVLGL